MLRDPAQARRKNWSLNGEALPVYLVHFEFDPEMPELLNLPLCDSCGLQAALAPRPRLRRVLCFRSTAKLMMRSFADLVTVASTRPTSWRLDTSVWTSTDGPMALWGTAWTTTAQKPTCIAQPLGRKRRLAMQPRSARYLCASIVASWATTAQAGL